MRSLRNHKGQALVEFALVLPILILLIMGIVQFGLVINSYLTIQNASREAARAGIIGTSDVDIKNLIITTSNSLEAEDLTVSITPNESNRVSGETLSVKLSYNYELIVPVINSIFGKSIVLQGQTSMRIE
jgi:Flp pilus assembly protein TadG